MNLMQETLIRREKIVRVIRIFIGCFLLISCESNSKNTTKKTPDSKNSNAIIVRDSTSKAYLVGILDSSIKSIDKPVTITGKFIKQEKYDDENYFLYIKTNDSVLILNNKMPLEEDDIKKLKKEGNNLTVIYSKNDQTIKFLSEDYEQK
jgi:hypothetical protein